LFTISSRGVYGLCAVFELGMVYHKGPIQIKDIAKKHAIPQHYLEQLLVILKKAGLVQSYRGSTGGYALAKSPDQIRVLDVLTSLDGKVKIVPEKYRENALSFFWQKKGVRIEELFTVSLAELILEKQSIEYNYVYTI